MNIKLIAIAKDEAAYLPEWIFHHLYYGFDSIDIYVNNTTDNTDDLIGLLPDTTLVSLIDGDHFFNAAGRGAQKKVYKHALIKAKESGFSHVMFLDIDEFWTPLDMSSSIKDCLHHINSDVISFEWMNKLENDLFTFALEENISVEHHPLVKSIINVDIKIENVGIHNVISEEAKYALADGSKSVFNAGNNALVEIGNVKQYVIIHRMYRSKLEYVSLLGRATPQSKRNFKHNRQGFCASQHPEKLISLQQKKFFEYEKARQAFFNTYISSEYMEVGREFVVQRYYKVLEQIRTSTLEDLIDLNKILRNVDTFDVNNAFSEFLQTVSNYLSHDVTNGIRDSAIIFETKNINKSLALMKVANKLRPKGTFIRKKVDEYKAMQVKREVD